MSVTDNFDFPDRLCLTTDEYDDDPPPCWAWLLLQEVHRARWSTDERTVRMRLENNLTTCIVARMSGLSAFGIISLLAYRMRSGYLI